ncbi:DUF1107 family protein [Gallaecimonas pentaromativorans]|uniref:Uncharacterized protein DUF1107 n=1 Tax=Gallaecimonas pentaromativorans TaxID=584787 RepID=A0A3N1P6V7_9GAMM|nr:DUF1107 family protein [Gallaecimonas pentaromativorans]MED5525312.1 DUF1107 family protein [Pseudomonadota bacterium]ROQ24275.1 uncharacterized protein DUF1107 [Gallaecimonas pentaromativorans]
MRRFPQYHVKQVAKHVAAFFEGVIWIKGVGAFRFQRGRMLPPGRPSTEKLRVVAEVNRHITSLRSPA